MKEVVYDRAFVRFENDVEDFKSAQSVISNVSKLKEKPLFFSSRFLREDEEVNQVKSTQPFGVYLENLKFAIFDLPHREMAGELQEAPGVSQVDFDQISHVSGINPDFTSQPSNWGLEQLGLLNATRNGEGVRVAILDSGVDFDHPHFKNRDIVSKNFNPVNPRGTVQDRLGHGTHVAGIIAGGRLADLRVGVAPNVELYIGKVVSDAGRTYRPTDIARAIDWAVEKKCKIINLSLGIEVDEDEGVNSNLQEAIFRAHESKAIVVAAVGNGSLRDRDDPDDSVYNPIDSPSNCAKAVAVSAVDESGKIYVRANRTINEGQKVDFIAPGVKIFSTYPVALSDRGGAFLDGTSMAAPFISGLLALYYQEDLEADPDSIIEKLEDSVRSGRLAINSVDSGNGMPRYIFD